MLPEEDVIIDLNEVLLEFEDIHEMIRKSPNSRVEDDEA